MATTTFVDQQTVIKASWLNDVNSATYGVTTAAGIQPAIDAAGAKGGGVVVLAAGTYVVTSTIVMRSGVTLKGVGASVVSGTVIQATALDGPIISGNSLFNPVIEDMYITGSVTSGNDLIYFTNSCHGVRINGVLATGSGGNCSVNFDSVVYSSMSDVRAGGMNYGFRIGPSSTSVACNDCYANGYLQYGWAIYGTYLWFGACASDGNAASTPTALYGYVVNGAKAVTFSSCGAESNYRSAFYITGSSGVFLSGCRSDSNNYGASISAGSFAVIDGSSGNVVGISCVDSSVGSGQIPATNTPPSQYFSVTNIDGSHPTNICFANCDFPNTPKGGENTDKPGFYPVSTYFGGTAQPTAFGGEGVSNVAQVYAYFSGVGSNGSLTALRSLGVSGIVKNGAGDYTISFTKPVINTNFIVQCTSGLGSSSGFSTCTSMASTSTTSVRVRTYTGGTSTLEDSGQIYVSVMGG